MQKRANRSRITGLRLFRSIASDVTRVLLCECDARWICIVVRSTRRTLQNPVTQTACRTACRTKARVHYCSLQTCDAMREQGNHENHQMSSTHNLINGNSLATPRCHQVRKSITIGNWFLRAAPAVIIYNIIGNKTIASE